MTIWNLEKYLKYRFETFEEGRWTELICGDIVHRGQPSDAQGQLIFNLTRQLGEYFQNPTPEITGYACFELGLILARNPDTLKFPPISIYQTGNRFVHLDDQTTEELPQVVVEHVPLKGSSLSLSQDYLLAGIKQVWMVNDADKRVEIHRTGEEPHILHEEETLSAPNLLPGLQISLTDLFHLPEW